MDEPVSQLPYERSKSMDTIVSIQFKDKNKVFKGKTYDFLLNKEEEVPSQGSIVRLMDDDYDWMFYGTRVKITEVKFAEQATDLKSVRYLTAKLD